MLHKQYQQGNTFLPFLGLITIAILITANIWLYVKSQKEIPIAPVVINPVATTTDEMSDWQTYTNGQYGFNIKYPSNWVAKEIPNQGYDGVVNFFQSGTKTYPERGGSQPIGKNLVTLSLLKNPDNLTLQEIFNNNYNMCLQQPNNVFGCPGPQKTESWQTITVDGAKAWRTGDIGIPEGPGANTLYIKQDGYYIEMTLMFFETARKNIDTAILNRMISTFRFTEDMSDWQTYTNIQYSYSFAHPADWKINGNCFMGAGREFECSDIYVNDSVKPSASDWRRFQVQVFDDQYKDSIGDDLDGYIKEIYKLNKQESRTLSDITPMSLNGHTGYSFTTHIVFTYGEMGGQTESYPTKHIFIPLNKKLYHVFYDLDNTKFDQILSTFKFIK